MGSSSGGFQAVNVGASFGTTWKDSDCIRRKDARTLYAIGYQEAAIARLCQSSDIQKAMEDAGTPCGYEKPKSVEPETINAGIFKGAIADYPSNRQYK